MQIVKYVITKEVKPMKRNNVVSLFFAFISLFIIKTESFADLEFGNIKINGKFDLAFESREFNTNPLQGKPSLINYHHFVFLTWRKKDSKFFFTSEVVERYFYEFGAKIDPISLKFGKILVPFGPDPLFHKSYGGLVGFDQKFLPVVWSEHGIDVSYTYKGKDFGLINEIYIVNAPRGDQSKVFLPNAPSSLDKFAVGDRITIGVSKIMIFLSGYFNQYRSKYNYIMGAADVSLPYGFFGTGILERFSLSAGVLRANVEGDPNKVGKYFHFADYLRLGVMLPMNLEFRFISGTKTIQNYEGLVYDKSTADENDTTSFNFALIYRREGFSTQFQYIINMEGRYERKDDLFRVMVGYEF